MKTLILSHAHPALSFGGGQIAAYRLFLHLRDAGEDAHFIGFHVAPANSETPFGRFERTLQFGEADHCYRSFGMDSDRMEHRDIAEEDWLLDQLVAANADVYHFHHFWNIGIGTILRLRKALPNAQLICTLHELTAICANHGQMIKTEGHALCHEASPMACHNCFPTKSPLHFRTREIRMKRLLNAFDTLIAPSFFLRNRFEEWGIAAGRIHVLENGVPFVEPSIGEETDLTEKSRRFAYFGRASPTKGVDILVQSAALLEKRYPDLNVIIDVHGVTASEAGKLWPDLVLPRNLVFHGAYAPEDSVRLMKAYGWIILPSIWWENAPVIFQEARLAGTPVISSDIGGMLEKSQDADLRFAAGNSTALCERIANFHGNAEQLAAYKSAMPPPFTLEAYATGWQTLAQGERTASQNGVRPTIKALKDLSYPAYLDVCQRAEGLTIFQHLPKTAGSSLVQEVGQTIGGLRGIHIDYPKDEALGNTEDLITASVEAFLASYDPGRTKCISGHLKPQHIARIRAAIPNTRLIAFLREPTARLISDYRYQCTPDHPPFEHFKQICPTFDAYLEQVGEMDKMWNYLLGDEPDVARGIAQLEETYTFIGLLERYDFSLNTVMLIHGKDVMPSLRARETQSNADNKVEADADLLARIAAKNPKDTALYRHFQDIVERQVPSWAAFREERQPTHGR